MLNFFVSHVDETEAAFIQANYNTFGQLDSYFEDHPLFGSFSNGHQTIDGFDLENTYPQYTFSTFVHHEINEACVANPLNVGSTPYDDYDVLIPALNLSGLNTSYAGCGPNAMVGILDYFSRYLNYTQIISTLTENQTPIEFVSSIYSRCTTYDVSMFVNENAVMMFPWDYANDLNDIIEDCGISNLIHANYKFTVLGAHITDYWNTIVENINNGLPVTLMTSAASGSGNFGAHAVNIYGYEIVEGTPSQGNSEQFKFLKAMINGISTAGFYCDARILNDPFIGIVTYDLPVVGYTTFHASDTADVFVNANGNGQYFYDTRMANVNIDGYDFPTYRLRTSYIENQYLVMSPNRVNAGQASLEIFALGRINFLRFHAGMWGYHEGIENETFFVEVARPVVGYVLVGTFDLSKIGWKENMTLHTIVLPYGTYSVRFRAVHSNPVATTNKGRICLENIQLSYTHTSDS